MPFRSIPVLLYHQISASSANEDIFRLSVSPRQFKQQMAYLYENGYRCLSLEEVWKYKSNKKDIPKKAFAITFDDGYEDNYKTAYPIMRHFGFTATIFIITSFVSRSLLWPGSEITSFLSWKQIEEMEYNGISFGGHTHTHPDLTEIPLVQAEEEICRSKEILGNRLEHKVDFFAYPGGHQNEQLQKIVKECNYRGACGVDIGLATYFNSWRVQINTDDSLALFRLKVSGWFEWLKKIRKHSKSLWWMTELTGRSLNRIRR